MSSGPGAPPPWVGRDRPLELRLEPHEVEVVWRYVWRILAETPATLAQAALFGSRARGDARPDSDVDLLLVFRRLPWDREPTATIAERIAEEMADRYDVPIGSWTVSLEDLREGSRTPMLVDALQDAIPVWCWPEPLPAVEFTPADALNCCAALVERLEEGSVEFGEALRSGEIDRALRRGRDDIVRAATGILLLDGITRPRRGDAPWTLLQREAEARWISRASAALRWCAESFGPDRQDDQLPIAPPDGGPGQVARAVETLAAEMVRRCADAAVEPGEPYSRTQFTD